MRRKQLRELIKRIENLEALAVVAIVTDGPQECFSPPPPISEPLDIQAIARAAFLDYSSYNEAEDIYSPGGTYI